MKATNLTRNHSLSVSRGLVEPTAARAFSWVEDMVNGEGAGIPEGSVVVVVSDGTIELADTLNDPRPTGIALDTIDDGETGQVCFGGPVDLVLVTASVTAGQYGQSSTTPGKAQVTGSSGSSFLVFTDSGTEPSAFLWGGRGGGGVFAGSTSITTIDSGSLGSTETINVSASWLTYVRGLLTADLTVTLSGATAGALSVLVLGLEQDGTGGWDVTWPGSVVWVDGVTPTPDTTPGSVTFYELWTDDGGITWFATVGGSSGAGVTYGTPAIVLGTAAAAGSIDEAIRRDATIVAFDSTAPADIPGPGVASSTGSVAKAARRDHKHALTYHDEPLTDGASNFIFDGGDVVIVTGVPN